MAKIVILNGPPGCGKDTIAIQMIDYFQLLHNKRVRFCQFKDALYRETQKYYGIPDSEMDIFTDRLKKETPNSLLNFITPRQGLIHVSENEIKPKFGRAFFGKEALKFVDKHSTYYDMFLFADGGFIEEAAELAKHHEVIVLRLRHGCMNFSGDSRNYLSDAEMELSGINYADYIMHNGKYMLDTYNLATLVHTLSKSGATL